MVMKRILVVFSILFLQGCYFNERGISGRYYNDCKEYYDAAGIYHKKCDENYVDYEEIKDGAKKLIQFD